MANHPQRVEPEPDAKPWRLTDGLDEKLAELRAKGLDILWIEACREDLTALVMEGGDTVIRLDPDPGVDRAWYGDVEIRHTALRTLTWIFVRGEEPSGEVSAYIVSAPDPPRDPPRAAD
jgi:hypothetical protein